MAEVAGFVVRIARTNTSDCLIMERYAGSMVGLTSREAFHQVGQRCRDCGCLGAPTDRPTSIGSALAR